MLKDTGTTKEDLERTVLNEDGEREKKPLYSDESINAIQELLETDPNLGATLGWQQFLVSR
jgi:hypothetical protein